MSNTATPALALVDADAARFDVVVIGGAFAGASSALMLRRMLPNARILIVERLLAFDRKVGEATVEVSAYFLYRYLGLYDHLSRHQLPKHGLRYWFTDGPDRRLADMSEIGGKELPLHPSFQLDRSVMDEHLLHLAGQAGATVLRGARIESLEQEWPESRLTVATESGRRAIRTRWIIDASGREGFLASRQGQRRFFDEHVTAAVWARFEGVADMDAHGEALFGPGKVGVSSARRLATNHFCGYGWWCWVIPLRGGETSIGLVYDKRLFDPGLDDGGPRAAFLRFLTTQPGLRELLSNARMVEHDFNLRRQLAYTVDAYAGKGWMLVGDAASFLDPFYSPGLDHVSISSVASTRLIAKELEGGLDENELDSALDLHNGMFKRSIQRWLDGLYVNKYELMGDAELMRCGFLVDTSLYYLCVVHPVYRDSEALGHPVFGLPLRRTYYAATFMRWFKDRLVKIARFRMQTGRYGARNIGWRAHGHAFDMGSRSVTILAKGLLMWLRLELEVLQQRLRGIKVDVSAPARPLAPRSRTRRTKAAAG